jgi:catechol 2,3-dioxygenase-like lactoylglutathione lyase family enzyme
VLKGAIDHLDLTVSDLAVSVPFYREVLGYMGFELFRLAEGNPSLPIFQLSQDGLRVFSIALQPAKRDGNHDRRIPGLHHIAFAASSRADVDEFYRHLLGIRAKILDPPAVYPQYAPGYYAVFFVDPDGLKLEYVHMPTVPGLVA